MNRWLVAGVLCVLACSAAWGQAVQTPEARFGGFQAAMGKRDFAAVWPMLTAGSQKRLDAVAAELVKMSREMLEKDPASVAALAKSLGLTLDELFALDGRTFLVATLTSGIAGAGPDWMELARAERSRVTTDIDEALVFMRVDGAESPDPVVLVRQQNDWRIRIPGALEEPWPIRRTEKVNESWAARRALLNARGLDVVIVFDSTGSMGGVILELKTRIRQLAQTLSTTVPNTRIGLVTYRDRKQYDLDDYEYTVKYIPLQPLDQTGLPKLQRWLRECEAYGGGDIPEAVYEGLDAAIAKSQWRDGTEKIIIMMGDAPPRPEDDGIAKTVGLAKQWHEKTGGVVHCIDTTGGDGKGPMAEFAGIAKAGGGEAFMLADEKRSIDEIAVLTLGSTWRKDIQKLLEASLRPPAAEQAGQILF